MASRLRHIFRAGTTLSHGTNRVSILTKKKPSTTKKAEMKPFLWTSDMRPGFYDLHIGGRKARGHFVQNSQAPFWDPNSPARCRGDWHGFGREASFGFRGFRWGPTGDRALARGAFSAPVRLVRHNRLTVGTVPGVEMLVAPGRAGPDLQFRLCGSAPSPTRNRDL